MTRRASWWSAAVVAGVLAAQEPVPVNLARTATATASEDHGAAFVPALAVDGDAATRWSGIPGHNAGVWLQLEWPQPVTFQQVVLHQFDTYVMELDVQVWDAGTQGWRALRHCGRAGEKLPLVVAVDTEKVTTTRLRLAEITNGPSFTEVEVWAEPVPPVTVLGSDLHGSLLGEVCDAWGSAPVAGAAVELTGAAAAGAWQAGATSDQHGMFAVPMPFGLRGDVAVRTTVGGRATTTKVAAVGLQYGLTPVSDVGMLRRQLDSGWRFLGDPPAGFEREDFDDAAWAKIEVPGHWAMQGFRPPQSTGGYRCRFDATAGRGRWLLRFDGVYSGARVWVNGTLVAEHDGGATPFEVDVTEVVRPQGNVLAVLATEHTPVRDRLDSMSQYADFDLGGIYRPVQLLTVPELHLGAMALATTWAADGTATVQGTVTLVEASLVTMNAVELRVRLREPGGAEAASAVAETAIAAWSRRELPVSLSVPAAKAWNAEQPFLYELELELRAGGRAVQTVTQRFGLRQTEVRGREILVNGRPVKLRGVCHHDSDPLRGRAVTPELQRRDVELMRGANLNAVRTSHYPPHEALLDAADELGLYVEDEASFCWTSASDDLRLLPRIVQLECEMVARDRNRASVTLWSLCNESRVGFGLWRAREVVRRLDPSRPIAGSWAPDGSLDCAVRHNPITIDGIDEVEKNVKVPVLWDESFCIWQDIWGDSEELWRDPGLRDAYVVPLRAVYDRFVHSPAVQGSMIWAWADDIFLLPGAGLEYGRGSTGVRHEHEVYQQPGRGVVGDAQWGIVDGWRREKPEYWHVQKLHSPIRLDERLPAGGAGPVLRLRVENQFDFVDLRDVQFAWELGELRGTAHADLPARSRGELVLELPRALVPDDRLRLEARRGGGRPIDVWQLVVPAAPTPTVAPPAGAPLAIRTEARLNGSTTFVRGDGFELGIGQELGELRRGTADGHEVLRSLPQLHVLATGRPAAPLTADPFRRTGIEVRPDGDAVVLTVRGRCGAFEGSTEHRLQRDGRLQSTATFRYNGDDVRVREIGMSFAVPRACDLLQWRRQGEWSCYPDDHIGRSVGRTRATTRGLLSGRPFGWYLDNTPLGSNDFRSTKRHLLRGWLGSGPWGTGLAIEGDGTQNLHAMLAGDAIEVVVTDYLGGINGLGEWTANYGTGRVLKQGETLTARVVLQFGARAEPPPK